MQHMRFQPALVIRQTDRQTVVEMWECWTDWWREGKLFATLCENIFKDVSVLLLSLSTHTYTVGFQGNRYHIVWEWPWVLADGCGSGIGHTHTHTQIQIHTPLVTLIQGLFYLNFTINSLSSFPKCWMKTPTPSKLSVRHLQIQVVRVSRWHLHKMNRD